MLKTRVLTAAVLLAVFLSALFLLPTPGWIAFCAVLLGVAAWEWGELAALAAVGRLIYSTFMVGVFALLWILGASATSGLYAPAWVYYAAGLFWIVLVPVWIWRQARFGSGRYGAPARRRRACGSARRSSFLPARRPGNGLDLRHGCVFYRPALRTTQARPFHQSRENLGRRCRSAGGSRALRPGVGKLGRRPHESGACMDPSGAARTRHRGDDWRSVRISDKTPGGGQGQRHASTRPWGDTRPNRCTRGHASACGACLRKMTTIQNIAILGATGSIGASTLDVIARHPSRFRVVALTANRRVDELAELCKLHRPGYACVADASLAPRLREHLAGAGLGCKILAGEAGLVEVASLPAVD